MAFKTSTPKLPAYETPYDLFKSLTGRTYADLMGHQRDMLETYLEDGVGRTDVAMQLPTGSGKTLVGLLIAEWRRRKFHEKVVYICPTKQLVAQTNLEAKEHHKIRTLAFVGSRAKYSPKDKAAYQTGKNVAITTYSSVFNSNSFFNDADVIIVDDAHAAENYIASMWSMEVNPTKPEHKTLHDAICLVLKPHISMSDHSRLLGLWERPSDASWYDKLPTAKMYAIENELSQVIAANIEGTGLEYSWGLLADKIKACHLYLSSKGILLRPLIPPTWSLKAFSNPSHRIYMSATLGRGGDLERLTGRSKIHRLPVPTEFQRQGVGRRFFMFPEMSLTPDESDKLRLSLLKMTSRGVIITPDKASADGIAQAVEDNLPSKQIFSARDIESSKVDFVNNPDAVVIMANRYDGVDFPKDDSRLLCVDGLPSAMNAQEKFIMTRMGATVIFNERIQTRVLQAIGRCTRSLQDYSGVFVTGQHLQNQLTNIKLTGYYTPELQAEIAFGIEQSHGVSAQTFIDNFKIFLSHDEVWESANAEIIANTQILEKIPFPALDALQKIVSDEVEYQKAMWQGNYPLALEAAKKVITGILNGSDLRGYRALWHYLAGSAAFLSSKTLGNSYEAIAREHFSEAQKAANLIPWFAEMMTIGIGADMEKLPSNDDATQIEKIEGLLLSLGTTHDAKYVKFEKQILDGLNSETEFENAHKLLGEALGFDCGKVETSGSPDPWWMATNFCFVFEDHANSKPTGVLTVTKSRQASSHPNWMRDNVKDCSGKEMIAVLISPVSKVDEGGHPHLKEVFYWNLEDFKTWAQNALSVIRQLRGSLSNSGDLVWRAEAIKLLSENSMTATKISQSIKSISAYDALTPVYYDKDKNNSK